MLIKLIKVALVLFNLHVKLSFAHSEQRISERKSWGIPALMIQLEGDLCSKAIQS